MGQAWIEHTEGGIRIRVRLIPGAGAERIDGFADNADGRPVLKAAVTKAPEGGKANRALIQMLAKAWRVPKSSVSVVLGETSRNKTLLIEGDAHTLAEKLAAWMQEKGIKTP